MTTAMEAYFKLCILGGALSLAVTGRPDRVHLENSKNEAVLALAINTLNWNFGLSTSQYINKAIITKIMKMIMPPETLKCL